MTVQFPTFRHTVADQMADYRERIAERIRIELARRGEGPNDLAYAVGVDKRTVERWEAGERQPQGANLKALADYFEIPIEELRPDLELAEQAFREQMKRIEEKQDRVLAELAAIRIQLAGQRARQTAAKRTPPRPQSGSRAAGK